MKTRYQILAEFILKRLYKLIVNKKTLQVLVDSVVHIALSKKIVNEVELHQMFDESIRKYNG